MSEFIKWTLIFCCLSILSGISWHALLKRQAIAVLSAAITTTIAIQLSYYLLTGTFTPFFIVTFLAGFILGFLVAMVIAVPFKLWRREED